MRTSRFDRPFTPGHRLNMRTTVQPSSACCLPMGRLLTLKTGFDASRSTFRDSARMKPPTPLASGATRSKSWPSGSKGRSRLPATGSRSTWCRTIGVGELYKSWCGGPTTNVGSHHNKPRGFLEKEGEVIARHVTTSSFVLQPSLPPCFPACQLLCVHSGESPPRSGEKNRGDGCGRGAQFVALSEHVAYSDIPDFSRGRLPDRRSRRGHHGTMFRPFGGSPVRFDGSEGERVLPLLPLLEGADAKLLAHGTLRAPVPCSLHVRDQRREETHGTSTSKAGLLVCLGAPDYELFRKQKGSRYSSTNQPRFCRKAVSGGGVGLPS